jgi:hypothetical protein
MTDHSDSTLRPSKPAWAAELSEREWLFCEQFAVDLNIAARSSQDFACCGRATASARSNRLPLSPHPARVTSARFRRRYDEPRLHTTLVTEHHLFGSSRIARSKSALARSKSPLRCKVMPRLI